jgi:hypothetical protein
MESAKNEGRVIRDKGPTAIKGIADKFQKKLGDYSAVV